MTKKTQDAERKIKVEAKEVSIALEEKAEEVGAELEEKAVDVNIALQGTAKDIALQKRKEHIVSFCITFLWLFIGVNSGVLDILMEELRRGELSLATVMAVLIALGRNALRVIPDLASLYFLKFVNYLRERTIKKG